LKFGRKEDAFHFVGFREISENKHAKIKVLDEGPCPTLKTHGSACVVCHRGHPKVLQSLT
jgi:hypothetical protein